MQDGLCYSTYCTVKKDVRSAADHALCLANHKTDQLYFAKVSVYINNNNNVHLSCAYQCPERSHDILSKI